jgi:hypothetical protein
MRNLMRSSDTKEVASMGDPEDLKKDEETLKDMTQETIAEEQAKEPEEKEVDPIRPGEGDQPEVA